MAILKFRVHREFNWGFWIGTILFFFFLLVPVDSHLTGNAQRMLAVAVLMAVWWMTEALPLAVTSLLPLVLYPILKIMKTSEVSGNYTNHLVFLFLGGFLIAIAIQKWGLHRRFALKTIYWLGRNPRLMILGFMVATAALSMWISNTATALMIMPIGLAVIRQIQEKDTQEELEKNRFGTVLMLAIAYSASIGGIGTLIGTPPNLVFSGIYHKFFPNLPEVSFLEWMEKILPLTILLFLATYFYLAFVYLRQADLPAMGSREVIASEVKALGQMNRPQKKVLAIFFITALLWIFRSDIQLGSVTIPGWPSFFGLSKWIQDSTIAIGMATFLFIFKGESRQGEEFGHLLHWKDILKLPWDILLLFGGGFALAEGVQTSGLAHYIGLKLTFLGHLPIFLFLFILALSIALLTEITSNTAVATTILPVIASLTIDLQVAPLPFMLTATVAASCAFMLPVATPPNAIVFGTRYVPIRSMIRVGAGLIITAALISATYFTLLF